MVIVPTVTETSMVIVPTVIATGMGTVPTVTATGLVTVLTVTATGRGTGLVVIATGMEIVPTVIATGMVTCADSKVGRASSDFSKTKTIGRAQWTFVASNARECWENNECPVQCIAVCKCCQLLGNAMVVFYNIRHLSIQIVVRHN